MSHDPINPGTAHLLREHVIGILARGGVPAAERDELAEELFGHLVERLAEHRASGLSETDAAARAISDFGGAGALSPEFGRVYHSRLRASTIGTLLPAVASATERPGVVGWLRFTLGVAIVVTAVGLAVAPWTATPLPAVASLLALGVGLGVLVLAFQALGRGQRWALWYAVGVCVELLAWGIGSVLNPEIPTTFTIPLGAILAIGVLFGVAWSWDRLVRFVAGSPPVSRWLASGLIACLVLSSLAPSALGALPDPTQATAADLVLRVSMHCDRGYVGGPVDDAQRIRLVAETTWRRGDVLPAGLFGLVSSPDLGDTAGFRLLGESAEEPVAPWVLVSNDVPVVDAATGATVGWSGSTSPSVNLLPETPGSFTVGVPADAIRASRTIRTTWLLTPSDREAAWPRAEVSYAHLDRFLVQATTGCGESVVGRRVPVPPRETRSDSGSGTFPMPCVRCQ